MKRDHAKNAYFTLPIALTLLAVCGLATSVSAETEAGWRLRFYAAAIDVEQSSVRAGEPFNRGNSYAGDVGGGLGVNAEYRLSERLGIDFGLLGGASVDFRTHSSPIGGNWWQSDTLTFTPLTAGLDVHLSPQSRVDFYACPMVALIHYGSLSTGGDFGSARSVVDFDEEVALGAALGLGVPFAGRRWSFEARVTYLDSSLRGEGADGLRIDNSWDSAILGVGFGYRFGQRAG